MKYYVIAGECSGDLHGGNLVKELYKLDPNAEVRGWGGEYIKNAGGELVVHHNELAIMGFWEVFISFFKILRYFNFCKKDILSFKPDALVLIDFAGFNLRVARFAHEHGIKVYYYISPKIWAWNTKRVKKIQAFVDEMFVILPFEESFYKQFDVPVHYVGNPLWDAIKAYEINTDFVSDNKLPDKPIIALLPGSRKQEIAHMYALMLELASHFQAYSFVIGGIQNLPRHYYNMQDKPDNVFLVFDQTYDLLSHARVAVVTSGTASLETALFRVPQLVVYKTSWMTYYFVKLFINIKVRFISLVNLIVDKLIIKEFIQKDCTLENLKKELNLLLSDERYRGEVLKGYDEVISLLGKRVASEETARYIVRGAK